MIYEPIRVLDLRLALGQGIVSAAQLAAIQFVAGENQPWAYYVGAAAGYTAAATSIPGGVATLYVVANTVDVAILHSPDGSLVRTFVDGVEISLIDTFAGGDSWESLLITGLASGVLHRIDIVNDGPSVQAGATGIPWMALGSINVSDGYAKESLSTMADTIAFVLKDAEADTRTATMPVLIPSGAPVADIQLLVDAIAPEIDAVSGSVIDEVTVTLTLTLPGGLKSTPTTNINNERGGLITFDTTGPRAESVRIPGISPTIMPGNEFSLTDTDIAALITRLTTETTYGATPIRPVTPYGYQWSSARKGRKSRRK